MTNIADQLLDAQVSWAIARLTDDEAGATAERIVDHVLSVAAATNTGDLVSADEVKALARDIAQQAVSGTLASTVTSIGAEIALDDSVTGGHTISELIDRDHFANITDEALALTPLLERILDDVTKSPIMSALAAKFVSRIVNDVVASNKAVAEKIPGVGSLVSIGSLAAGKVIGKTGEQFEQMFSGTAAKGAEFMAGRLNKMIIATLNDPQTRTAVLEVYDLYADEPTGVISKVIDADDAERIAALGHDVVGAAAASEPVLKVIDAFVDGIFRTYGDGPATEIIDDLGLTRDDLVSHAQAIGVRAVKAAKDSGELEKIVRAELEPFFASPEVAAILK